MSSNHHHDHHSEEKKPVSFTVPFILASVTLLIIVLFLSLCDPKHGHHGECECKEDCSTECMEACEKGDHSMHPAKAEESKEAAPAEAAKPAEAAATEAPAAEAPAAEHKEEAH
jgi:hypothetical protein